MCGSQRAEWKRRQDAGCSSQADLCWAHHPRGQALLLLRLLAPEGPGALEGSRGLR